MVAWLPAASETRAIARTLRAFLLARTSLAMRLESLSSNPERDGYRGGWLPAPRGVEPPQRAAVEASLRALRGQVAGLVRLGALQVLGAQRDRPLA